jgi:hypothetical protein
MTSYPVTLTLEVCMCVVWFITAVAYHLCSGEHIEAPFWLLLIPFAFQDIYDASRRR